MHPTITLRPVSTLVPYARNSRKHSDTQIAQIMASIQEWGWTMPILVDGDLQIIAGHARHVAAQRLGIPEVPTIQAENWTDAQKRAYVLADNKLTENGGWDFDMLAIELGDLGDLDLSLTGFDDDEIASILAEKTEGLTDEDDAPEPPEEPITQTGDVWTMGKHRLMCGDSTSADDVRCLVDGAPINVCLTDPPYGLGDSVTEKNNYDSIDDSLSGLKDIISGFLPIAMELCPVVVLTPGNGNQKLYPASDWVMAWFVPAGTGRGPWGFCCWQPILCYGKDPKLSAGKGSHPDALVKTETAEKLDHPCPKPTNMWRWLLERVTNDGFTVYEPFSGSGTTIIAAEQTGRSCYAMEISPAYVDVAVKRWEEFTGKTAVRNGEARTKAA